MPTELLRLERPRAGGGFEEFAQVVAEPVSLSKSLLPPRGGWAFDVDVAVQVFRGMRVRWFGDPFTVVAVGGSPGGRKRVTMARQAEGKPKAAAAPEPEPAGNPAEHDTRPAPAPAPAAPEAPPSEPAQQPPPGPPPGAAPAPDKGADRGGEKGRRR